YIAALTGAHAMDAARKFRFEQATTDYQKVLADKLVNAVFILTGHNSHARLACEALRAGKHVFVEKPLALTTSELDAVASELASVKSQYAEGQAPILMVGYNRRFSPHTQRIKEWLTGRHEPLCMAMTVNAGHLPADHWAQDPKSGGGRIIGEACHFL